MCILLRIPLSIIRLLPLVVVLVFSSGCARSLYDPNSLIGEAIDVPDHFLVGSLDGAETTEPVADGGCRSPMIDPRDGTRLLLATSAGGRGDYQVPEGRYGVGNRERLRLDCGTGRALGIVRR